MPAIRTSKAKVPSSAGNNKTLLIILEEEGHQRLKNYAAIKRRSMSDIVREKIDGITSGNETATPAQ